MESIPVWKMTYHAHHFASVLLGAAISTPAIKGQMTMTKMRTKMIQNDWCESTQWSYLFILYLLDSLPTFMLLFFSMTFIFDWYHGGGVVGGWGIYWFSEPTYRTLLEDDEITFITVYDMTLFANFHIRLIKGRAAPQTPLFAKGGPNIDFQTQLLYLSWKRMKLSF